MLVNVYFDHLYTENGKDFLKMLLKFPEGLLPRAGDLIDPTDFMDKEEAERIIKANSFNGPPDTTSHVSFISWDNREGIATPYVFAGAPRD